MKKNINPFVAIIFGFALIALLSSGKSMPSVSSGNIDKVTAPDTAGIVGDGIFSIPELSVVPSPDAEQSFTFQTGEKVIDYDVSPSGLKVAVLTEKSAGKGILKFPEFQKGGLPDSLVLPSGLNTKAIAFHPMGNVIFIMGENNLQYQVFRIEKIKGVWNIKKIFNTVNPLRRLVVCPRPFITSYNADFSHAYYQYRLFFGMDNGDKTYRIVSITENGNRFYQVVGPSRTFTKPGEDGEPPSTMEAAYALPVAFHPSGYQLIWEDKSDIYKVATYDAKFWGNSKPLNIKFKKNGTITPTPNGLGLIHWQKEKPGVGIYLFASTKEENQVTNYSFISTPSSVPDGKGIVGLTNANGLNTLRYLPVKVPLADVTNAWMFNQSDEETNLFVKYSGLFRPGQNDQLYQLYETENYNCGGYDRNSPTRPYLVTTDIFWELFGAAYQGLFIVKERDEAILNFWKFINEGDSYFKQSGTPTKWGKVFTTLINLKSNNLKDPEVKKIKNLQDQDSEITNKNYPFSDLKPRGHYTSSPEMENYFKAFRYFTTILKEDQETVRQLNLLPEALKAFATNWINAYSGFIAPSRSQLVWDNIKTSIPEYCKYPGNGLTQFPLSWGFDNEVLYSTVYHDNLPKELQVTGASGDRLLPSGTDLATVLGNSFAEKLLESDYRQYPPLRKVINNLKTNFKQNGNLKEIKSNLYTQWINTLAVQWSDTVTFPGLHGNQDIWDAKRLQTGLASWATLRHATILVNERTGAECGEGGFEEILMRAPRGYVEPDPYTFNKIAGLFDTAVQYVSKTIAKHSDMDEDMASQKKSLYDGILSRLKEAADEAHVFQKMAEKEKRGEALNNEENEKILYVARVAEHLFLVFNSLSNKDYALSNPDPMAKIADVAGNNQINYLMSAVGKPMEWNMTVPFYGRQQIVKGSIYSYFEFKSNKIINDQEWRSLINTTEYLPWIKPYISLQVAEGAPNTSW